MFLHNSGLVHQVKILVYAHDVSFQLIHCHSAIMFTTYYVTILHKGSCNVVCYGILDHIYQTDRNQVIYPMELSSVEYAHIKNGEL